MASLPTFSSFNSPDTGKKYSGSQDTLKPKTSAGDAEKIRPAISELVQNMMPRLRENDAWMATQMRDRQLMRDGSQAPLANISNSNGSNNAVLNKNKEDQQSSTVQSMEASAEDLNNVTIGRKGNFHPSASTALNDSPAPAAIVQPPANDGALGAADIDPMSGAGLLIVAFKPINFLSFFFMPRVVTGLFLTICLFNQLFWNKDHYIPSIGFAPFDIMMVDYYEPFVFVSRVSIAALFIKALSAGIGPLVMLALGPPVASLLLKEHYDSESVYYAIFCSVVLLVIFSAGDVLLKNIRTKFDNKVLSGRSKLAPAYYFYVMGSGGHTTEMVALIRLTHKADKNAHRRYLWTVDDHHSANQIILLEHALKMQLPNGETGTADGAQTMRARGVGQSYISSINTSIQSAMHIANALVTVPISRINDPQADLFRFPDVIVTNGPGTGFIVAFVAFTLKVFFVAPRDSMKVVFMETWARGQHLGLTGNLMRATKLANVFVVQSQEMANTYNLPSIGNVNQKWADYCQKKSAAAAKQAAEHSAGQSTT